MVLTSLPPNHPEKRKEKKRVIKYTRKHPRTPWSQEVSSWILTSHQSHSVTKRRRKVKRSNVSVRDPVQAGEMLERGPYTALPPKDEEKSKRLMYRSEILIPGRRNVGVRALHNTFTKKRRKVKKTNVSIRDWFQAVEMWEWGPYTILSPKKEKSKRLMYRSETDSRP